MFMFSVYQNCCAYSPFPYNEFLMRDIYARFMVCYFQNKRPSPVFGSLFSLLFGLPALCLIFLRGTSVPTSDRELPPPRGQVTFERKKDEDLMNNVILP